MPHRLKNFSDEIIIEPYRVFYFTVSKRIAKLPHSIEYAIFFEKLRRDCRNSLFMIFRVKRFQSIECRDDKFLEPVRIILRPTFDYFRVACFEAFFELSASLDF